MASVVSLDKFEILDFFFKYIILGPKTAILGSQFVEFYTEPSKSRKK